jgi:hypothetical protein
MKFEFFFVSESCPKPGQSDTGLLFMYVPSFRTRLDKRQSELSKKWLDKLYASVRDQSGREEISVKKANS